MRIDRGFCGYRVVLQRRSCCVRNPVARRVRSGPGLLPRTPDSRPFPRLNSAVAPARLWPARISDRPRSSRRRRGRFVSQPIPGTRAHHPQPSHLVQHSQRIKQYRIEVSRRASALAGVAGRGLRSGTAGPGGVCRHPTALDCPLCLGFGVFRIVTTRFEWSQGCQAAIRAPRDARSSRTLANNAPRSASRPHR